MQDWACEFEAYAFDIDARFLKGMPSILARWKNNPIPTDVLLKAKAYYFQTYVQPLFNLDIYLHMRAGPLPGQPSESSAPPPLSPSCPPSCPPFFPPQQIHFAVPDTELVAVLAVDGSPHDVDHVVVSVLVFEQLQLPLPPMAAAPVVHVRLEPRRKVTTQILCSQFFCCCFLNYYSSPLSPALTSNNNKQK